MQGTNSSEAMTPTARAPLVAPFHVTDLFRRTRLGGICLVIAVLLLWEASVRLHWIESVNWPAFTTVVEALVRGVVGGELLGVIGSTLWRMIRGFVIGGVLGLVVGFALALFQPVRRFFEPTIEFLRPIPIPAIIPPLIFVFGLNDPLKLFVIAFAVFFPVMINTLSGVLAVERIYLQVAQNFGHSRPSIVRRVLLPASLPFVMAGLRTSLALALVVTVVAEMIAGSAGVGYYLTTMQFAMRAPDMYAAIVLLAMVAYAINRGFMEWESHVIRWARLRENN